MAAQTISLLIISYLSIITYMKNFFKCFFQILTKNFTKILKTLVLTRFPVKWKVNDNIKGSLRIFSRGAKSSYKLKFVLPCERII